MAKIATYRHGISIPNPTIPQEVVYAKRRLLIKYGRKPKRVSRRRLRTRTPYYRRRAKARTNMSLGFIGNELPNFNEVGLGELAVTAPGTAPTTKSFWGSLTSVLTQAGTLWQQREERRIRTVEAEILARQQEMTRTQRAFDVAQRAARSTFAKIVSNPPLLIGVAGAGLILMMTLKKRRRAA